MSLDATRWAWNQNLDSKRKIVLLSLADRAGEYHTCYPSLSRLMQDTGITRRQTVIAILDELEAKNLIRFTGKTKGNGVKVYELIGVIGREDETSNKNVTSTKNDTTTGNKIVTGTSTKIVTQNLPIKSTSESIGKDASKKPKKPKTTTLPNDLEITQAQIEKCKLYGLDVFGLFENFKNHHGAKGSEFANWSMAFNTWINNEIKFNNLQPVEVKQPVTAAPVTQSDIRQVSPFEKLMGGA